MENKKIIAVVANSIQEKVMVEYFSENQIENLTIILNSLPFKEEVTSSGGQIYAVGGIVRDALMAKQSDDLDIVIRGIHYEKLFSILSKYGKAKDTSIVDEFGKKDFGATKFVSHNEDFNNLLERRGIRKDIDVMLPRKDSKNSDEKGHRSIKSDVNHTYTIWDDLMRRDITINAVSLDLKGNVIGIATSIDDIQKGIIRAVSEDAFVEDPLRLLRAIRFAARFNFKMDERTLELIKKNAHLLSDKKELPKERFLIEFEKMIGKSDLGRAVKLLAELGLYKHMFGIDSVFTEYSKFDSVKNVADFSFMLFEHTSKEGIIKLIEDNITNNTGTLKHVLAIIYYIEKVEGCELESFEKLVSLSYVYNMSSYMLLSSIFTDKEHIAIAQKFKTGEIPSNINDVMFKGEEFKNFIVEMIQKSGGEFNQKTDSFKMGIAKKMAMHAIYKNEILNEKEEIKNFLTLNSDKWIN